MTSSETIKIIIEAAKKASIKIKTELAWFPGMMLGDDERYLSVIDTDTFIAELEKEIEKL